MSTPMPTQMPNNFTPISPADAREMARSSLRGQSTNRSGLFSSIVEGLAPIGAGIANVTGHKTLAAAISASGGGIGSVPTAPSMGGGMGVSGGSGEINGFDLQNQMRQSNLEALALTTSIQNETRRFTTLSDAKKASHDASMNSIRNIK